MVGHANAPAGDRGAAAISLDGQIDTENNPAGINGQVSPVELMGEAVPTICESCGAALTPCPRCSVSLICDNCDASDICLACQDGAEPPAEPKGDPPSVCEWCRETECICAFSPWPNALAGSHPAYKQYVLRLRDKARARS